MLYLQGEQGIWSTLLSTITTKHAYFDNGGDINFRWRFTSSLEVSYKKYYQTF